MHQNFFPPTWWPQPTLNLSGKDESPEETFGREELAKEKQLAQYIIQELQRKRQFVYAFEHLYTQGATGSITDFIRLSKGKDRKAILNLMDACAHIPLQENYFSTGFLVQVNDYDHDLLEQDSLLRDGGLAWLPSDKKKALSYHMDNYLKEVHISPPGFEKLEGIQEEAMQIYGNAAATDVTLYHTLAFVIKGTMQRNRKDEDEDEEEDS